MKHKKTLEEDISQVLRFTEQYQELQNCSFFITGATGLLGSLLTLALLRQNQRKNCNITVLVLIRNEKKAKSLFCEFLEDPHLIFIYGNVIDLPEIKYPVDYIIHGASITDSSSFVKQPVETIDIALSGSKNILELAKQKKVHSMLYLSSLEIYGTFSCLPSFNSLNLYGVPDKYSKNNSCDIRVVDESDYGYLDITRVRSSYSESKRMVECMCSAYACEYQVPVKIARLTQTFGAGVNYNDNRVFAQFARCVIEGKDIVLHTKGETVRNYCYTTDAICAMLTILLTGQNGEAYNVANEETSISIKEMASHFALLSQKKKIQVIYELDSNETYGYNPVTKINLSTKKLASLGWQANINFSEMIRRLLLSFEENKE